MLLEYLPILCLDLDKSLEMLLLLRVQHDKGLMLGVLDASEVWIILASCEDSMMVLLLLQNPGF